MQTQMNQTNQVKTINQEIIQNPFTWIEWMNEDRRNEIDDIYSSEILEFQGALHLQHYQAEDNNERVLYQIPLLSPLNP